MTILQHSFQNFSIPQALNDSNIAGKFIPKGYVNATAMCKANNKTWSSYFRSNKAQSFASKVSTALQNGIPATITIEGGNEKDLQGTWVHPKVAMHLAMWISDDFAFWATDVLLKVVNGDYKALTPEAQLAAERLSKLWSEIRKHGKETRRKLTDAIASYIDRHPELEQEYLDSIYAGATNSMYLVVFGMTALELEDFLGCKRNHSRDCLDRKCLMAIDRAEEGICNLIDYRDVEPYQAVKNYRDFFYIQPLFPSKKLEYPEFN